MRPLRKPGHVMRTALARESRPRVGTYHAAGTEWLDADLGTLADSPGLLGLVVPKAENPHLLRTIDFQVDMGIRGDGGKLFGFVALWRER